MDRNYIDNHHVVARYLADQLSEDDRRAFEAYLQAHPDIVADVEAAARLKVGLRALNTQGELSTLLKATPRFRDIRTLAMAASVAVIAIGALLWFGRNLFAPPTLVASITQLTDRGGKSLPIAGTYAILRTRGIAYDAEVALPEAPQAIELRLLPEYEAHPARYRVALARIADDNSLTPVGAVSGLVPSDDGFVALYFDSSKLSRGRYQMTISGAADTDAANNVSVFKIRLVAPDTASPL